MITVTLIGEPGTGKTSIRKQFLGESFSGNQSMSIGATYKFTNIAIQNKPIKLRICDIAGQQSFEFVRQNYMNRSNGALLIFDITNIESFKKVTEWATEFLIVNPDKQIPILVVGNKSDLAQERKVRLKDVEYFLKTVENNKILEKNIIGYIEASAKTGDNVSNIFSKLTYEIEKLSVVS